jgi:hypothetical protein
MPVSLQQAMANIPTSGIEGKAKKNDFCGKIFNVKGFEKFFPGWLRLVGTPSLPTESGGGPKKKRKAAFDVTDKPDVQAYVNAWHEHWLDHLHNESMELYGSKKKKSMEYLEEIFRHPLHTWVDDEGNEHVSWSMLVHPNSTTVYHYDAFMPDDGRAPHPDDAPISAGVFDGFRPHPFDRKTEPPANDLDRALYHDCWLCVDNPYGFASAVALGVSTVATGIVIAKKADTSATPQTQAEASADMGFDVKDVVGAAEADARLAARANDVASNTNEPAELVDDGQTVGNLEGYTGEPSTPQTEAVISNNGSNDSNIVANGNDANANIDANANAAESPATAKTRKNRKRSVPSKNVKRSRRTVEDDTQMN